MNIDWSQLITKAMKDAAAFDQQVGLITAEVARLRKIADQAASDLEDAVDIDEASDEDLTLLKEWKKYRVALSKVPVQAGYPTVIDWPIAPA